MAPFPGESNRAGLAEGVFYPLSPYATGAIRAFRHGLKVFPLNEDSFRRLAPSLWLAAQISRCDEVYQTMPLEESAPGNCQRVFTQPVCRLRLRQEKPRLGRRMETDVERGISDLKGNASGLRIKK